jgi:hypothetical protein
MPATCRAPRRAVPPRQTDAGDAIGREALDTGTVASGATIKAGDRSRGPRSAMPPRHCGFCAAGQGGVSYSAHCANSVGSL